MAQGNRRKSSSSSQSRSRKSSASSGRSSRQSSFQGRLNSSKKFLRKASSNPLVLYLGGGLAAGLLGRFAYRYYKGHPEISEFIQENVDNVESKLRDFRSGGETEIGSELGQ